MKQQKLTLFLIIILSLFCLGSFTDEWGEYQDDETGRGFVHDDTANFDEGTGITYTDSSNGMNYQPFIVDFTGDSSREAILYSGNFIRIYSETLGLIDEKNIGTIESQPIIYNNGTDNIAVAIVDDVIEAWSYNGTNFIDGFSNDSQLNSSFNAGIWSGLRCSGSTCYSIVHDSGLANMYIVSIYMNNATFSSSSALSPNEIKGVPVLDDFDRDGNNEIVISCDANTDNLWGVCVVDLNSLSLDTGFSTDGILDGIAQSDNRISNPLIYNIDGGGDSEILISTTTGTDDLTIIAYKSDGTQLWTDTRAIATVISHVSDLTIIDGGDTYFHICGLGEGDELLCSDKDGVTITSTSISGITDSAVSSMPLISADMDNDGIDELVSGAVIMEINGTIIQNITNDARYFSALGDFNIDNELEILSTKSGISQLLYSSFSNEIPVLNDTYQYSGFGNSYGYGVIVCIGDTITYSAQEIGGTETGNYQNDGSEDTERLRADCELNGNITNGTYDLDRPIVTCTYNTTGVFETRLYINDLANPDDVSEFNTDNIVVNVVDGIRGITCGEISPIGVGETLITGATDQTSEQNDRIRTIFDPLTGTGSGSNKLKMVIALMFVIFIMGAFSTQTGINHPLILFFVGLMATVIFTFFGMLPPYVIIIVSLLCAISFLIARFVLPSGGE